LEFAASAGVTYRIEKAESAPQGKFSPIGGQPATHAKKLGTVSIGIDRP
jgi:hypothetical protein